MSAICLCRPSRYALCLWMYMTGSGSSFLKGYKRHLLFGMRASGGSLYLITTPLNVLVSSTKAPDSSKFGFSFSAAGAESLFCSPPNSCASSPLPLLASRLRRFSRRRSLCCSLSACCCCCMWASLSLPLCLSCPLSRSLWRGRSPSLFTRRSFESSLLSRCLWVSAALWSSCS